MANAKRYFKTPFAESGNKTEVPDVSVGGAVGYDTGFGPDYELPQGTVGRKRIERDMYNGVQHSITSNLKQWQERLYPTWIEDTGAGAPFSYSAGMIVNHASSDWISNENANEEEPGTGGKWSAYVPNSGGGGGSDIADITIPYFFETFAAMVSSTIAFVAGKVLKTKVYSTALDQGGAEYIVRAGASPYPVASPDLTGGGYAQLNVTGGSINIEQFGGDAGAAVDYYNAQDVSILVGNNTISRGTATNMLIQSAEDNQPNRIHQEPRNDIQDGTVTKVDFMFSSYESDPNNYAISQVVNYIGDPNDTGEGMITAINAKSVGSYWGNWPSIHLGFNDDSDQGMAAKIVLTEWTGSEWYTPMRGAWFNGKPVTAGDYITANFKVYRAANTGGCGNIIPSHTSGTVSDGNINFEWIHTPNGNAFDAVMLFGERDDMPLFGYPGCHLQVLTPMLVGGSGRIDFVGDDGDLNTRIQPVIGGGGERITDWKGHDGNGLVRFDSTNKKIQTAGLARTVTSKVQNGTDSPDVSATELIRFGNTSAQDVVRFNGAVADQIFMVETTAAGSGFTTIKGNVTSIKTIGNVDIVLDQFTILQFKMNYDGTRAIQVGS